MHEGTCEGMAGLPSPGLRSLVARYHGYRLAGPPGSHRALPSSTLTFVISLADPVDVRGLPGPCPGPLPAFVAGLYAGPAHIPHEGLQFGIQVDVSPLSARPLFGLPAGELAGSAVALSDLLGAGSAALVDRLHGARSWPERFAVLDQVLLRRLDGAAGPPGAIVQAWASVTGAGPAPSVRAVAEAVGYSRRHLADLFARELGLSPRAAARVARFERSRAWLARGGEHRLATVAASAGYYDQAHMAHEWSALAGCPPSTWVREELPLVQDKASLDIEDGGHEHSIRP